jgi:hypothetical protein
MPDREPDKQPAGDLPAGGARPAGAPDGPGTGQAGRRRAVTAGVLVPAITFLVGLLLGTALMWAGSDRGDEVAGSDPTPAPSQSAPTTSATGRPDATVTVPGSCLDLADSAEEAAELVEDAATAAQDLDASELSSIVRQMQESRTEIESRAGDCRSGVDL